MGGWASWPAYCGWRYRYLITSTTFCGLRRGVPVLGLLYKGWPCVGVPAVGPEGMTVVVGWGERQSQ